MLRLSLFLASAVFGLAVDAGPAAAQFGGIFGGPPPRPPSGVPNRPPAQSSPDFGLGNSSAPPVQSQPLPSPGGYSTGYSQTPPAGLQPNGQAPVAALPPGQRQLRAAPAGPQPDDETTELPSQKIANPTAVFAGLDKITGRIISFDVAVNETVQFGGLRVTRDLNLKREMRLKVEALTKELVEMEHNANTPEVEDVDWQETSTDEDLSSP